LEEVRHFREYILKKLDEHLLARLSLDEAQLVQSLVLAQSDLLLFED